MPVFQTVSRTYGFLLGDIATILQVTWLPMLVIAVLNFYVGGASMDEAIAAKGEPGMSQTAGASYLVGFLALLAEHDHPQERHEDHHVGQQGEEAHPSICGSA